MSAWICRGCGRESTHIRTVVEADQLIDVCDHPECGHLSSIDAGIPDVFWNGRPYYSEALECEFTSRSQKARVMKEKGVSELGSRKLGNKDWMTGTREARRKAFERERPVIRETLKRWKETGYARTGDPRRG